MSVTILERSRFHDRGKQVDATDAVLTGDRPTGSLHLGHYAGSLRSRIDLQGALCADIAHC